MGNLYVSLFFSDHAYSNMWLIVTRNGRRCESAARQTNSAPLCIPQGANLLLLGYT